MCQKIETSRLNGKTYLHRNKYITELEVIKLPKNKMCHSNLYLWELLSIVLKKEQLYYYKHVG